MTDLRLGFEGPRAGARTMHAPDLRNQPLPQPILVHTEGSPLFVLGSFQNNELFFNETNKVVGQLTFFRKLVAQFKTPQTKVWEFQ